MSRPSSNAFLSCGNVGDVREHAQLDLAVVGRDQLRALLGDEGGADLAAFLGADRDVLQVGLGRGEAARRGGAERVAGVDAPRVGVDVGRQRVGVGRAQLGELAPLEHRVDQLARVVGQLLVGGEIVEQAGARLPLAGLGALAARQLAAGRTATRRAGAGEPRLNLWPTSAVDLLLEPRHACANVHDSRERIARSTLMPARSMSAMTGSSGRSSVS